MHILINEDLFFWDVLYFSQFVKKYKIFQKAAIVPQLDKCLNSSLFGGIKMTVLYTKENAVSFRHFIQL